MIRDGMVHVALIGCLALGAPRALAEEPGRIEGRVTSLEGRGYGGVGVAIQETAQATITDAAGRYRFNRVVPGTYTLEFSLLEERALEPDVVVIAGATAVADVEVDWELAFAEQLTVYAASRRQERVVDAPAAVTVIPEERIEREAAHGQLPKLLEFTPGAEVTQSGIYDYNLNLRGFNSSLNRRVATLIDGRDPSLPFLGAQEWAAVSFPLDDAASLELVRGPSAALYGANASSGVLNVTTKQPRYSQGGQLRLTGGELDTLNADLRYADEIGRDWYFKVIVGARSSGDFAVSRNGAAEYSVPCPTPVSTNCLPQEAVPLVRLDDDEIYFGSLRFDKYMERGGVLSLEGGTADVGGPVFQTGIGRVQVVDVQRPWARVNYTTDHWDVLAYYTGRDAGNQRALSSGAKLVLDETNLTTEVQTNWHFADERVRLVGGASFTREEIDSADPATGAQTLLFRPVDSNQHAAFGQLDWQLHEQWKLVLAGRYDDSSLHDPQFSPKASLVWTVDPNHTLRLTYNEAFQVANYSEYFLQADIAAPLDLSQIEQDECTANGVACGFGAPTRVLAVGNAHLDLEEVRTFELGYSAILGRRAFLTLECYHGNHEDFITDLIPQVDASQNRTNPDFGPYQPPGGHPDPAGLLSALQTALGPSFFVLSNNFDGTPVLAARTYGNFGEVDTRGIDLGLSWFLTPDWTVEAGYSWFDFELADPAAAFSAQLLPNSPENKAHLGLTYVRDRLDASIAARWVDDFRWVVGPFQGDVESYTTVDLGGNYAFDDHWKLGIHVANLLDEEHWESFGGDLLERRGLIHVVYSWN